MTDESVVFAYVEILKSASYDVTQMLSVHRPVYNYTWPLRAKAGPGLSSQIYESPFLVISTKISI